MSIDRKPADEMQQTRKEGPGGASSKAIERPLGKTWSERLEAVSLPLVWFAVFAVFAAMMPETFLSGANFASTLSFRSVMLILTLALLVPLIGGDFDLSIASVLTLTAMIIAQLNVIRGWGIGPTIAVAVLVALLIGLINGLITVGFGIQSLVVTLGTSTFIEGIILWISGSNTVSGISPGLVNSVIITRFLGVPMAFWYAIVLSALIWYVLEYTVYGKRLLFVGRNRQVSRLSGIKVSWYRVGAFVSSALIASIGGIVYAGMTGSADPSSGLQFLLPAFAAAFLGATTITPGRFNVLGSIIAVYFLATGITGLQLFGADSYVQQLFYGGALVIAVAVSQVLARRRLGRVD